jgi:hypothetical protein
MVLLYAKMWYILLKKPTCYLDIKHFRNNLTTNLVSIADHSCTMHIAIYLAMLSVTDCGASIVKAIRNVMPVGRTAIERTVRS